MCYKFDLPIKTETQLKLRLVRKKIPVLTRRNETLYVIQTAYYENDLRI